MLKSIALLWLILPRAPMSAEAAESGSSAGSGSTSEFFGGLTSLLPAGLGLASAAAEKKLPEMNKDYTQELTASAEELQRAAAISKQLSQRAEKDFPQTVSYEGENTDQIKRLVDATANDWLKNVETTVYINDPKEVELERRRNEMRKYLANLLKQKEAAEAGSLTTAPIVILEPRKYSLIEELIFSLLSACNPDLVMPFEPSLDEAAEDTFQGLVVDVAQATADEIRRQQAVQPQQAADASAFLAAPNKEADSEKTPAETTGKAAETDSEGGRVEKEAAATSKEAAATSNASNLPPKAA